MCCKSHFCKCFNKFNLYFMKDQYKNLSKETKNVYYDVSQSRLEQNFLPSFKSSQQSQGCLSSFESKTSFDLSLKNRVSFGSHKQFGLLFFSLRKLSKPGKKCKPFKTLICPTNLNSINSFDVFIIKRTIHNQSAISWEVIED